jgi:sugar-specific transcriptional regulator TrmB
MDDERLREALSRAGLTDYQSQAYLALLEMGSGPVVDVAERTDVPASRVYEVVRNLADEGFVETIERDKLHARAIEPNAVQAELRETGSLLTDAAEAIEDRWESPSPEQHLVSVVTREATVLERVRDAITDAEVSVELAVTAEQFRAIRPTLEAAAERGVVLHVTVNGPLDGLDGELADTAVTEVRHSDTPGALLAVVDRLRSFLSPTHHPDEEYGVLVDDRTLSFMLHWMFLTCGWVPWDPIAVRDERNVTYVSIEEFVAETASPWYDDAEIEVSVLGRDTDSGERVTVEGTLARMLTDGETPPPPDPGYETLGGTLTLVVATDDGEVTVGGWGAVYEDVEAQVVRVTDVSAAGGETDRNLPNRFPS